jgi:hypothetical protein
MRYVKIVAPAYLIGIYRTGRFETKSLLSHALPALIQRTMQSVHFLLRIPYLQQTTWCQIQSIAVLRKSDNTYSSTGPLQCSQWLAVGALLWLEPPS